MISDIKAWHAQELQKDYGLRGRMVMGCPLWGVDYVNDFLNYCWPSVVASTHQLTQTVLYVDEYAERQLSPLTDQLILKRLPDNIANRLHAEPHWKYPLLAACHNLLIHKARDSGAGFHMMVADTVYSDRYFTSMERLEKRHAAIAHTGFAVVGDVAKPVLRLFCDEYRLSIPAQMLGELGWEYLNPQWRSWTMDGIDPVTTDAMPNSHYIHWRSQDFVRIHCAHQSAAWISNARCQKVTPDLGGTVDSELPRYLAGDFYTPRLEDEMAYVVIVDKGTVPTLQIPFEEFKREFWRFTDSNAAFIDIFKAGVEVPVTYDASAPTREVLDMRLGQLMARLGA